MQLVSLPDLSHHLGPADVTLPVGASLGTTDVALKYYELAPGDSFAYGYHRHHNQEEVFVVLAGTVTFETEMGDVTVGVDDAIRFAPGEFQRGWNRGDERVRALAIGAPKWEIDTEIRLDCPVCASDTEHRVGMTVEKDAMTVRCVECETETARYD